MADFQGLRLLSNGTDMDADAESGRGTAAIPLLEQGPGRDGPSMSGQVLRLAGPVLVEQFLLYLVGLSDTLLTARYLGEDDLAAVANATYLLWFLGSLMTVVSVGATALVARLTGAGEPRQAARTCQQAIFLALSLGSAVLLLGLALAPAVVDLLELEGRAADGAVLFLRLILLASPLLACATAGIACLRGVGDTRTGMWVMILVNAINVGLSWGLVSGLGIFPSQGFAGIAIGTAISEAVGGLAVLVILARGRSGLRLDPAGLRPRWRESWRILRISLPASGESLTNVFCQMWFLRLINHLGPTASAAHGVAIRCEALAFLTVTAFSVAAGTLTGQYLGAGRPDLAARAGRTAWAIGVAVLMAVGVLLYAEAGAMFHLFLGGRQPEVTAEGVPVLRIVAFALPGLATLNVLNGALRGAGDTRWPWIIVMVGYLGIRMPLTYWFTLGPESGGLGLGLRGAWFAMLADLTLRGVLVAARYLHGGWKTARV
ncbi:MATE family efflux transporter [Tundrisphaera sp. TA3]|uniref:MATE family efflux transporter n=1 Tax=Tundrisphaera sp. TA3 TaxID=3435775 RepID=UPI003EB733BC